MMLLIRICSTSHKIESSYVLIFSGMRHWNFTGRVERSIHDMLYGVGWGTNVKPSWAAMLINLNLSFRLHNIHG